MHVEKYPRHCSLRSHRKIRLTSDLHESHISHMTERKLSLLRIERLSHARGDIVSIILSDAKHKNALSTEMLTELRTALERLRAEISVRAVVLSADVGASGTPVFSSGHDLREVYGTTGTPGQLANLLSLCSAVCLLLQDMPQPTVALVDGLATAAGCQLAASCDIVVATRRSTFATPGVRIGTFCSTPAVAISRCMQPKQALLMLLTGNALSAEQAAASGLVTLVTEDANTLWPCVMQILDPILTAPAATIARKREFYSQLQMDRRHAFSFAERIMADDMHSAEGREGIGAFLGKRKPKWPAAKL